MIKVNQPQIFLEFGDGDIGCKTMKGEENGEPIGIIGWFPIEAGEIGRSMAGIPQPNISDVPVLMVFKTVKALESTIRNLELLKRRMESVWRTNYDNQAAARDVP